MVKGGVELKRIENKINRRVTFAKRRNGLLKKAYELSVLCDAEVALIIFSNRGRLFEFSSNSNLLQTLDKYQKSSNVQPEASVPLKDDPIKCTVNQPAELEKKEHMLHHVNKNLVGRSDERSLENIRNATANVAACGRQLNEPLRDISFHPLSF